MFDETKILTDSTCGVMISIFFAKTQPYFHFFNENIEKKGFFSRYFLNFMVTTKKINTFVAEK